MIEGLEGEGRRGGECSVQLAGPRGLLVRVCRPTEAATFCFNFASATLCRPFFRPSQHPPPVSIASVCALALLRPPPLNLHFS